MHPDARVWGLVGLVGFVTGKLQEGVCPPKNLAPSPAPDSFNLTLTSTPKRSPYQAAVSTQGPQDPWGGSEAQSPDSTHRSPLGPGAVEKCTEILGELSLTAAPSPVPLPLC